jgi:L-histidine N-alpha-methyltransferase
MAIYRNQVSEIETAVVNKFNEDVLLGLTSSPKVLQSKYFYDAEGDKLFQMIMGSPEYYLTDCELEIFSQQTEKLAQAFLARYKSFDIIELGAGDATKSAYLLKYLTRQKFEFTYFPIDISHSVISYLRKELPIKVPGLEITGLHGEYFDMINAANKSSAKRKLVLFLGSNIGNFSKQEAVKFLIDFNQCLAPGDTILIGFDLKKNPHQILAAYNDRAGVTKQFNLNLLKRINFELGGDFDVSQFDHYATYDPLSGSCKSYLISLKHQSVRISDKTIHFLKNEPIYMELSQKYSVKETQELAEKAGFKQVDLFYDNHQWFVDAVWEKP